MLSLAGLLLVGTPAHAGGQGIQGVLEAHVAIPWRGGRRVRGGLSVGLSHVPYGQGINLNPTNPRARPVYGGSIGFDHGHTEHTRVDLVGHGGVTVLGDEPWCGGMRADLGLSWLSRGSPVGLYVGARAFAGPAFMSWNVGAAGVVRPDQAGNMTWADSFVRLGLDVGPLVVPGVSTSTIDGRLLREAEDEICAPFACPRDTPVAARERLAAAATEWTSVSTFLRTARELQALGAPSTLVARHVHAAREEVRHTVQQLGLARRLGLRRAVLGTVPVVPRRGPRQDALVALARESWKDGWLGERAAAKRMLGARDRTRSAVVAHTLHQIAHEEQGHADLGGAVTDWCVQQGGDAVRRALRA